MTGRVRHCCDVDEETECLSVTGPLGSETLRLREIEEVWVVTAEATPLGDDVWWVLTDATHAERLTFPLGAEGEDVILRTLHTLPGFAVAGMNATGPGRHLCWRKRHY